MTTATHALNMTTLLKVNEIRRRYMACDLTDREADRELGKLEIYEWLSGNRMRDAELFDRVVKMLCRVAAQIANPDGVNAHRLLNRLYDAYRWGMVTLEEADRWHHANCPNTSTMLHDGYRLPLEPQGPLEPPACEHCGCVLESRDDMVECGDHVFCGSDCAHEAGYEVCETCRNWARVDYGHEIDSYFYCDSECARDDGWVECDRCGEWEHEDNSCTVTNDGREETWCGHCVDYYARQCYGCGTWFNDDDVLYCDDDDEHYCRECYPESAGLHEYGYTPPLNFRGDARKSPYLGFELETDGGDDRNAYVRALSSIDGFDEHFYMTKDSSLNNGVEITSHPMTLAYAVSIGPTMEAIRREALAHGFRSHDGGRCGLHVHLNRDFFGKSMDAQDLGGYKLMRLLQRFERNFLKFARRRDSYWCNFQTCENYEPEDPEEAESTQTLLDKAKRMKRETNHAQALNFQHGETFEIRIFRGTLNMSTFYACLAMANGLAHVAKMHSAFYVENVTWTNLMADVVKSCDEPTAAGYLREYLEAHELM